LFSLVYLAAQLHACTVSMGLGMVARHTAKVMLPAQSTPDAPLLRRLANPHIHQSLAPQSHPAA
jgi:hypothetical protein